MKTTQRRQMESFLPKIGNGYMRGKASSGVALVLGKTFHFARHMTAIMVLKRFLKMRIIGISKWKPLK